MDPTFATRLNIESTLGDESAYVLQSETPSFFKTSGATQGLASEAGPVLVTTTNLDHDLFLLESVFGETKEDLTDDLVVAAENGDYERVKELAVKGPFDFGTVIYSAGTSGNKDLVEFLLYSPKIGSSDTMKPRTTPVYLNTALQGSALSESPELLEYLLDAGANPESAISNASRTGDRDIVISLLETICENNRPEALANVLFASAEYGHIDLVSFALGERDFPSDAISQALYFASKGGHRDIFDLLFTQSFPESETDPTFDYDRRADDMNWGIRGASLVGDIDWIYEFLDKGGYDISSALLGAIRAENQEAIDDFISRGADNWPDALATAVGTGDRALMEQFLPPKRYITNYRPALEEAIRQDNIELLDELITYVHTNTNDSPEAHIATYDDALTFAITQAKRDAINILLTKLRHDLDDFQYVNRINGGLEQAVSAGKGSLVVDFLALGAQVSPDLKEFATSKGFIDIATLL